MKRRYYLLLTLLGLILLFGSSQIDSMTPQQSHPKILPKPPPHTYLSKLIQEKQPIIRQMCLARDNYIHQKCSKTIALSFADLIITQK